MQKPRCIFCIPVKEFKSWEAVEKHVEQNHPGQVYLDRTYFNPLFNTIFVTVFFVLLSIFTNAFVVFPFLSVILILESGLFPILFFILDHKHYREQFSCPICKSILFPRIGIDREEYLVCANDVCENSSRRLRFK